MVKEYQKIWLKDNSIYTNDINIWKKINNKLKTSIQDRQEKPKSGMDAGLKFVVTYREFLQLAGDISAEYHFLGKTSFERPVLKKKIQRYLEYEYEKKIKMNPPDKKKEIKEELLAQLRQSRRINIKDKIPQINKFFRKIGINGNIFEEDGTDITQKVFSIIGPEYKKSLKRNNKRIIELGPHERGIIEFCNFEMNPLDSKKWPDARSRFKDMVGKQLKDKKALVTPSLSLTQTQSLEEFLKKDVETELGLEGKIELDLWEKTFFPSLSSWDNAMMRAYVNKDYNTFEKGIQKSLEIMIEIVMKHKKANDENKRKLERVNDKISDKIIDIGGVIIEDPRATKILIESVEIFGFSSAEIKNDCIGSRDAERIFDFIGEQAIEKNFDKITSEITDVVFRIGLEAIKNDLEESLRRAILTLESFAKKLFYKERYHLLYQVKDGLSVFGFETAPKGKFLLAMQGIIKVLESIGFMALEKELRELLSEILIDLYVIYDRSSNKEVKIKVKQSINILQSHDYG